MRLNDQTDNVEEHRKRESFWQHELDTYQPAVAGTSTLLFKRFNLLIYLFTLSVFILWFFVSFFIKLLLL